MPLPVFMALVLLGASAHDEPVGIELRLGDAAELSIDAPRLVGLLRLELATSVSENPEGSSAVPATVVAVRSAAEPGAFVVRVLHHAVRVERAIDLRDVAPEVRPRTLALVIAEMLRDGAAPSHEEPLASSETSAMAAPVAEAPTDSTPSARGWALEGDVGARAFVAFDHLLLDLRLAVAVEGGAGWGVRGGVGLLSGQAFAPLGEVHLAAPVVAVSGFLATRLGTTQLEVGPRLEAGLALASSRAGAESVSSVSGSGLVMDLGLEGRALLPVLGGWRIGVGIVVGYAVKGVEVMAGEVEAAGIAGPMVGVTGTVGW